MRKTNPCYLLGTSFFLVQWSRVSAACAHLLLQKVNATMIKELCPQSKNINSTTIYEP